MNSIFKSFSLLLSLFLLNASGAWSQMGEKITLGEDLWVQQLTGKAWLHHSMMMTESFGKVGCNGMIVVDGGECLVFDTPATDSLSRDLIKWLEVEKGLKVVGVIGNHYHEDCIGGLAAFHEKGIPSYSSTKTAVLAKEEGFAVPQITFKKRKNLKVGKEKVKCYYPGHAHAPDNIVAYFPAQKVLFGGCMVKSKKSGKGYLGAADVKEWPITIERVRKRFGNAEWVIPGHGKVGGIDLLDDTIRIITAPD